MYMSGDTAFINFTNPVDKFVGNWEHSQKYNWVGFQYATYETDGSGHCGLAINADPYNITINNISILNIHKVTEYLGWALS